MNLPLNVDFTGKVVVNRINDECRAADSLLFLRNDKADTITSMVLPINAEPAARSGA